MSEQKLSNTLWIVIPSLLAVVMSACGGKVQVVAKGLPTPPVALATDQQPVSADGFFWETYSTPDEHQFQAGFPPAPDRSGRHESREGDSRVVRVTTRPGETLLWCRQVGTAVYSLAGHGPDRSRPPCVIDPPFVLRRQAISGGPARVVKADLPSTSVFVMPSGAVCFADAAGIHRIPAAGGAARLICPRTDRNVTTWGAEGETLYWIEEAMPGGRDPVGSCRLLSLALGAGAERSASHGHTQLRWVPGTRYPAGTQRRPHTVAWAPDALTDLTVAGDRILWYHPAGRALEGVRPDGTVTVLARDINLATAPVLAGDRAYYLAETGSGALRLAATSLSRGGSEVLARLDASARIVGTANDGLYLAEEEGSAFWSDSPARTGRLLRVPLSGG